MFWTWSVKMCLFHSAKHIEKKFILKMKFCNKKYIKYLYYAYLQKKLEIEIQHKCAKMLLLFVV